MKRALLSIIILLAILIPVLAVSFLSSPTISPLDAVLHPNTEDNITCSWIASPDTLWINATWYNGTTYYMSTNITPPVNRTILPALTHTKGEVWNCNITLHNATGSTMQSTQVSVKNALPTPPNATNESLYEDQTFTTVISSSDADNDQVNYTLENGEPSWCTLTKTTGALSCDPTESEIGNNSITFEAIDDGDYKALKTVTYTVIPVNDPPEFSIEDQEATEDTPFIYILNATDEEEDYPFSFTIESNLTNQQALIITAIDNNSANITFNRSGNAPLGSERGTWWVRVNVTDNGSNSSTPYDDPMTSVTFTLTI